MVASALPSELCPADMEFGNPPSTPFPSVTRGIEGLEGVSDPHHAAYGWALSSWSVSRCGTFRLLQVNHMSSLKVTQI